MPTRKIMIVEDERLLLQAYREALKDLGVEILTASTLLEALELFEANRDVALIALDGCFPRAEGESPYPDAGMKSSGEKFVLNIDYAGPVIACSSDALISRRMVEAGATQACEKGRPLCVLIREILAAAPVSS